MVADSGTRFSTISNSGTTTVGTSGGIVCDGDRPDPASQPVLAYSDTSTVKLPPAGSPVKVCVIGSVPCVSGSNGESKV